MTRAPRARRASQPARGSANSSRRPSPGPWTPPRGDEDLPHLPGLPDAPLAPVFVMGLHRSGTTWLYQQLDRLLPVVSVTAHDVLAYPRLLDLQSRAALEEDRTALDAHFRALGLRDRQLDSIPLTHATVEEYGWVLLRDVGRLWLDDQSAPVLRTLCRKLSAIHPQVGTILLKNPWDQGAGPKVKRLFPRARFVFISRDPLWIADSQLRSGLLFRSVDTPYLDSLVRPSRLGRFVCKAVRRMSRAGGERLFTRIAVRSVMHSVGRELHRYRRSRDSLPPGSWIEVRYEALLAEPARQLRRVIEFLGLSPVDEPSRVEPRPRHRALHAAVVSHSATFVAQLHSRGLWEEAWDDFTA